MQTVPTHPGVVFRLGNFLMRTKRDEEGFKLLAQASALAMPDPGLSFIPLGYGLALDRARKLREAEGVYRGVIRADPESGHAYFYLSQLLLKMKRPEEAQIQLNVGIRLKSLTEEMVAAFQALQVKINEKSAGIN
jgi:tetratricopeptide (TPR) repeat protein